MTFSYIYEKHINKELPTIEGLMGKFKSMEKTEMTIAISKNKFLMHLNKWNEIKEVMGNVGMSPHLPLFL